MKIDGGGIRPGYVLRHQNELWVAMKTMAVKPGKGGAYNQVELKNLLDGRKLNERFRASEAVERVQLEYRDFQFLYEQGEMLVFMEADTFEQVELPRDFVGEERAVFLAEGMEVRLQSHEGTWISATLPESVVLEVAEADPVVKGQTVASSYKNAVLANGVKLLVPPFVTQGERIVVNTETGEYVRRAEQA